MNRLCPGALSLKIAVECFCKNRREPFFAPLGGQFEDPCAMLGLHLNGGSHSLIMTCMHMHIRRNARLGACRVRSSPARDPFRDTGPMQAETGSPHRTQSLPQPPAAPVVESPSLCRLPITDQGQALAPSPPQTEPVGLFLERHVDFRVTSGLRRIGRGKDLARNQFHHGPLRIP